MEDRSRELSLLPLEDQESSDPVSITVRLWSALEEAHADVNSLGRTNPRICISDAQADLLNGLLQQIIRLIETKGYAKNLRLIPKNDCYTYGDLLLLLGQYKGALRSYRINVLNESTYSF